MIILCAGDWLGSSDDDAQLKTNPKSTTVIRLANVYRRHRGEEGNETRPSNTAVEVEKRLPIALLGSHTLCQDALGQGRGRPACDKRPQTERTSNNNAG